MTADLLETRAMSWPGRYFLTSALSKIRWYLVCSLMFSQNMFYLRKDSRISFDDLKLWRLQSLLKVF